MVIQKLFYHYTFQAEKIKSSNKHSGGSFLATLRKSIQMWIVLRERWIIFKIEKNEIKAQHQQAKIEYKLNMLI